MLSIMVDVNPRQWDDMLPYNSSVHKSTGLTPAIAMFRRELRLLLYVRIGDHMKTQRRRQKCLYDCHTNEALLPELQRVVGHAKKTKARPRLGGALPDSGGNGATNVPGASPGAKAPLTGGTFCTTGLSESGPPGSRNISRLLPPPHHHQDEGWKADTKTMLMKCNDEMVLMKVCSWRYSRFQMSQSTLTRLSTIAIASQICIEVPRRDDQMSPVLVSMCGLSKILYMYKVCLYLYRINYQ
ncbi:hypothetical protein T02_14673 [Trichinella nativa]|uniref:Uncharacterized protein n=1 Tax=Trichinella nativa TaxID=6335 RepID=A0A0V1LAG7_9BILA|nr:hypothetical protein T02_14673 [Trichinella nativa]